MPSGVFVDLSRVAPDIAQDIRYAGSRNFTGARVPGYQAPLCLLTRQAAAQLLRAQTFAAECGLALKVFDGYRPQAAVDAFVRWAGAPDEPALRQAYHPRVEKHRLISAGYIAAISSHSRGSAVDVTLVRRGRHSPGATDDRFLAQGELDMGTPFDFFDPASHTESREVTHTARLNRRLLRSLMMRAGFRGIDEEWWHFILDDEPFPLTHFDFPVAQMTWLGNRNPPIECA